MKLDLTPEELELLKKALRARIIQLTRMLQDNSGYGSFLTDLELRKILADNQLLGRKLDKINNEKRK